MVGFPSAEANPTIGHAMKNNQFLDKQTMTMI